MPYLESVTTVYDSSVEFSGVLPGAPSGLSGAFGGLFSSKGALCAGSLGPSMGFGGNVSDIMEQPHNARVNVRTAAAYIFHKHSCKSSQGQRCTSVQYCPCNIYIVINP